MPSVIPITVHCCRKENEPRPQSEENATKLATQATENEKAHPVGMPINYFGKL